MKHFELTTATSGTGAQIARVSGRIGNHPDSAQQTEWITFQLETDIPTIRDGAILRKEILALIRSKLDALSADFEKVARQDPSYR